MRRKFLSKLFILVLLIVFACFAPNIYATDFTSTYDNMFASNTFTIYTDTTIDNNMSLTNNVSSLANRFSTQEYMNSMDDYSYLNLSVNDCNYSDMKCSFSLNRNKVENGNGTYELVKNYDNVSIVIDSNIGKYFSMVNGDDIVINYDENMFSNEDEKNNYINNYFNTFSTYNNNESVSYSYDSYSKILYRYESVNSKTTRVMTKKINNITFEYTEDPYSDEFKRLTSDGNLTIKTDTDITNSLLSDYLIHFSNGTSSFSIDGNISNNKIYIKRTVYENGSSVLKEKHLITLIKDENVDLDLFNKVGYKTSLDIHADEPLDKDNYSRSYFNLNNFYVQNEDESYEQYRIVYDYNSTSNVTIEYIKHSNNGKVLGIEYHNIPVRYVGYSNQVSDKFNKKIGNKVVINADSLSLENINSNLNYEYRALVCNDDFSICDIAKTDYESQYETHYIEIHKVNVELNDKISDDFKRAFNIKNDGTIDIIMDQGTELRNNYLNYSYYDKNTQNSLSFDCNNKCKLSLRNYSKDKSETHTVDYNIVNSNPSSSYLSLVKSSIELYPGEATNVWNNLSFSYDAFSKLRNTSNTRANYCDSNTGKCSVIAFNSNNNIEIHNSSVSIKEGRSPKFDSFFPGDTITINSIFKDDDDYLYRASAAYLMSKTKSWSYLNDYHDGRGKIVYDGFETHTMNVKFAESNTKHKQIVDAAIERIGNQNLKVSREDLEYVNNFYYNDPNGLNTNNYNSTSVYNKLTSIINDKHISYYLVEDGGMGNDFFNMFAGKVVLFYDGIGYGTTNSYLESYMKHIIYVPNNTEDNPEAYVKAAQKRIDNYLGKNSGVVVSYVEPIDDADVGNEVLEGINFDGNCYKIAYKDREEFIIIAKDSSKMMTSTFSALDVNNNVVVSSDNANYPTNTVVSSTNIDSKAKKYKEILKKLGLDKAQIVDIDLYSPSIGDIENFDNVDFDVSVPITLDNYKNKKLYAYYIKDDGSVEEHPITLDDFIAKFETNHFSTYIIAEKVDDKIIDELNPKTGDNIKNVIIINIISVICLAGIIVFRKKRYN